MNAKSLAAVEDRVLTPVAIGADASQFMSIIAQAASDPNFDADKLDRIIGAYERVSDKAAEKAFNEAMMRAQAEIGPVIRNKRNDQTKSNYADLDAVDRVVRPIYTRHGFALSFGTADSPHENHYRVTCKVSHEGGFSRDYQADIPADATGIQGSRNKTNTHAFGSSMSYGRRYLLMLIFNVATSDDDGNRAGSGATITDEQVTVLRDELAKNGGDVIKFCRFVKVDALADIPASRFNDALRTIRERGKAGPR